MAAAVHRELKGHTGAVHSVHATADGQHVISGSMDKTVRVWAMADGALVRTLKGHTGVVLSVHATADGRHVISGSSDKTVRITPSGIVSQAATSSDEADTDVQIAGERTREERDAEGRKRAINLDTDDQPAAPKAARTESAAASSAARSSSAAPSSSAAAAIPPPAASLTSASSTSSVPGLDQIHGLATLMAGLPSYIQAAGVKWCEDNEADSTAMIVEAELDDAFVAALSLKPGGARELVTRKRLAALRS